MHAAPTVTDRDGVGDLVAGQHHVFAFDRSLGPEELLILAGDGETLQLGSLLKSQALTNVREAEPHLVSLDLVRRIDRTVVLELAAIGHAQGHARGAGAVA